MVNSYPNLELQKPMPSLKTILAIIIGLTFLAILFPTFGYGETSLVKVGDDYFDVEYVGDGVSVNGIESDQDFISLIFSVDVTNSQGVLQVTFDRSFFDSVYMGNDDDFIVLADGDEPSYSEIETTTKSRTLNITLPSGTEEVEIIGSVFGSPVSEPEPIPVIPEPPSEIPEPPTEITEPTTETPKPTTEIPETPKPKPEIPKEEIKDTKPKTECGPGTILKEGVCVLDQRCGPGTILKDGICVVKSTTSTETLGKQLVFGFIAAFVIAGIVGIILGLMSKASKSS